MKNKELEELTKKQKELEAERNKLQAQIMKIRQEEFVLKTNTVFEKHPKLKSWAWHQYTPYFNDGDVCEFSVYDYYIDVDYEGFPKEELSDSGLAELNESSFDDCGNYKKYTRNYKTGNYDSIPINIPGLADAHKDIRIIMDIIKENAEDIFGDHARIVVSKDSIKVEKYDHE